MHARFRARRRRRPAIAALGVALVVVLGACDTQPATDITHNAATLNARGACYGTMNGIWQYELRRVGGPWNSVGPLHPFACGASGAETAIQSHRATGLQPNTTYQYRIRAYENNSAREYYFDSTGADRGTNYDQFRTLPSYPTSWNYGGANHSVDTDAERGELLGAMLASEAAYGSLLSGLSPGDLAAFRVALNSGPVEEEHTTQVIPPPDADGATAVAAGGVCKVTTNIRKKMIPVYLRLRLPPGTPAYKWLIRLSTAWCHVGGRVTKMYPAQTACGVHGAWAIDYVCDDPEKVRANCYGGSPERCAWTYYWSIDERFSDDYVVWCATNQIRGDGRDYNHGSCDLRAWSGPEWGGD